MNNKGFMTYAHPGRIAISVWLLFVAVISGCGGAQQDKLAPKTTMPEALGWAVRKDDQNLQNSVNEFVNMLSRDGRLKRSINKWIPYLGR